MKGCNSASFFKVFLMVFYWASIAGCGPTFNQQGLMKTQIIE